MHSAPAMFAGSRDAAIGWRMVSTPQAAGSANSTERRPIWHRKWSSVPAVVDRAPSGTYVWVRHIKRRVLLSEFKSYSHCNIKKKTLIKKCRSQPSTHARRGTVPHPSGARRTSKPGPKPVYLAKKTPRRARTMAGACVPCGPSDILVLHHFTRRVD